LALDVASLWRVLILFWRFDPAMREMRSYRETLTHEPESSISRLNRRLDESIPFQWHHHPEYELTLTLNSRGKRFIGDHVGDYDDGDLVLVGPNLPHTWYSREKIEDGKPHVALVVWFHPDRIRQVTHDFIEFRSIDAMLARAGRGLRFTPGAAAPVRERFERLFSSPPVDRLLTLLHLLHHLAGDDAEALATTSALIGAPAQTRERIDRVLTHVHANYARTITLGELADLAALSQSGLHRLFLKHTGKAVSDYLAHMRIGDACARLSGTTQSIGHIAGAVGYASLANFNRQFRALKRMTPRDYRRLFG